MEKIEAWRQEYNHFLPHSSLGDMTPMQYIETWQRQVTERDRLPGASSPEKMPSGQTWPEGIDCPKPSVPAKRNKRKKGPKSLQ